MRDSSARQASTTRRRSEMASSPLRRRFGSACVRRCLAIGAAEAVSRPHSSQTKRRSGAAFGRGLKRHVAYASSTSFTGDTRKPRSSHSAANVCGGKAASSAARWIRTCNESACGFRRDINASGPATPLLPPRISPTLAATTRAAATSWPTTSTLRPVAASARHEFASVADLPVPGGPLSTNAPPATHRHTARRCVASQLEQMATRSVASVASPLAPPKTRA